MKHMAGGGGGGGGIRKVISSALHTARSTLLLPDNLIACGIRKPSEYNHGRAAIHFAII